MGLLKQRKVGLDWYELLCFGSPTALFVSLDNLFCNIVTEWCIGPIVLPNSSTGLPKNDRGLIVQVA